jgi:hypothetical protein
VFVSEFFTVFAFELLIVSRFLAHHSLFENPELSIKSPPIKATNQRAVSNNLPQNLHVWGTTSSDGQVGECSVF